MIVINLLLELINEDARCPLRLLQTKDKNIRAILFTCLQHYSFFASPHTVDIPVDCEMGCLFHAFLFYCCLLVTILTIFFLSFSNQRRTVNKVVAVAVCKKRRQTKHNGRG